MTQYWLLAMLLILLLIGILYLHNRRALRHWYTIFRIKAFETFSTLRYLSNYDLLLSGEAVTRTCLLNGILACLLKCCGVSYDFMIFVNICDFIALILFLSVNISRCIWYHHCCVHFILNVPLFTISYLSDLYKAFSSYK